MGRIHRWSMFEFKVTFECLNWHMPYWERDFRKEFRPDQHVNHISHRQQITPFPPSLGSAIFCHLCTWLQWVTGEKYYFEIAAKIEAFLCMTHIPWHDTGSGIPFLHKERQTALHLTIPCCPLGFNALSVTVELAAKMWDISWHDTGTGNRVAFLHRAKNDNRIVAFPCSPLPGSDALFFCFWQLKRGCVPN